MTRHPAGWYADPHHRADLRWWDGSAWTHHVAARPGAAGWYELPGRSGAIAWWDGHAWLRPSRPESDGLEVDLRDLESAHVA